jgi:hypothetical protein
VIYRGTYYSAAGCDDSPRPGTNALVSWYLGAYRAQGASNLGTYACKRLGSGWSIHAERRAADLGTSPYGGVDSPWGWALVNALRLHSHELGIQLIILGHKVWSCRYPDSGWRTYTGEYHGHTHVELTPAASRSLTTARIQEIIGGGDVTPAELVKLLNETRIDSEGLGGRSVSDWLKGGVGATNAANAAKAEAAKATSEAALAKELAGQAGIAVARVEEKVDQLLARPPVELDYRALAGALILELGAGNAPTPEGG